MTQAQARERFRRPGASLGGRAGVHLDTFLVRIADCPDAKPRFGPQRVDSQMRFAGSGASSLGGPAASWDNSRSLANAMP